MQQKVTTTSHGYTATLPEMKNGEMFEGFSAFWSSSEIGFTGAGITPAAAEDKTILGTMARPQAEPWCNCLHWAEPCCWANADAYGFLWRLAAVI